MILPELKIPASVLGSSFYPSALSSKGQLVRNDISENVRDWRAKMR